MRMESNQLKTVNLIGLVVCLSLMGDLSLFAVLPTRYQEVGLTLANLGIVFSIHRLIRIPGNPLIGFLGDRWGRRKLLLLGMVLATISTASYGLAEGFAPLVISRICWGIAWMCINVSALSMIIDLSLPTTRGANTGRMTAWYMVGLAAGPIIGGILVDLLGFHTAMLICSLFSLVGFFIAWRFIPDPRKAVEDISSPLSTKENGSLFDRLRSLKLDVWLIFLLFMVVQFSGEGIILSTLSLKLRQILSQNGPTPFGIIGIATAGGMMLGFRSVTSILTTPFLGGLSDTRFGRRGVVSGGIVIALAGFVVVGISNALVHLILGVALSASGAGAVSAVVAAWLGDLVNPAQRGFVMGLYSTAGDIGSTTGPVLAYVLINADGLNSIYLLCAGLFAVCLVVMIVQPVILRFWQRKGGQIRSEIG